MTDIFTKEKRSEIMSRIKARNTKMELATKKCFGRLGFAYHPKGIIGNPDFAHVQFKIAVFLDGCFWHGCPEHFRPPKSNREFWGRKIRRNVERDRRTNRELRKRGWLVIRVWEHEIPIRRSAGAGHPTAGATLISPPLAPGPAPRAKVEVRR